MHCFCSARQKSFVKFGLQPSALRFGLSFLVERCFAIQKQLVSNLVGGDIAVLLRRLCVVVVKLFDQFPRLMAVSGHVQVFNCGLP